MALITNFANAGDGILASKYKNTRRYRAGDAADYVDYREVTDVEVRVWVGLSKEAATSQVALNAQPSESGATYSYTASEDNRVIGSYTLERTYENKTTAVEGQSAPPEVVAVSFSKASQTVTSVPVSVDITHPLSGSIIFYRIDSQDSSGNYVAGSWVEGADNSETVSVQSDVVRANGGIHQNLKLLAYAQYTTAANEVIQGVTSEVVFTLEYAGAGTVTATFTNGDPLVVGTSTSTGVTNTVASFPVSLTAQSSNASDEIMYAISPHYSGTFFQSTSSYTSAGTGTVNISIDTTVISQLTSWHKRVRVFIIAKSTFNGTDYYSQINSYQLELPAPTFSISVSPGQNAVGDYVDLQNTGVEALGNVTVSGSVSPSGYTGSTSLFVRSINSIMPTRPFNDPGQVWPYSRYYTDFGVTVPSYTQASYSTSQSVSLVAPNRFNEYATRLSDSAVSGSGLRLAFVLKVQAYYQTTIDGVTYQSSTVTKYVHCKTNVWS